MTADISLGHSCETDSTLPVALAILAASTVATGVAMSLSWLLDNMGIDPGFGSGPLSTVIQDLLSLTIDFGFATAIVI